MDSLSWISSSDSNQAATKVRPSRFHQYFATIAATMGAVAAGNVGGFTSPAGAQFLLTTNSTWLPLSVLQSSWFSSSPSLGAAAGGVVSGISVNLVGRRITMMASGPPYLAGWILVGSAQNFGMLLAGRLLCGVCVGISCGTVPTFIAECASADIRGALGTGFQLMVTIGVLYAFILGTFVSNWRWLAALSSIPVLLHFGLVFFTKESPVFLLSKGRLQEMVESLQHYRGSHYNVEEELKELQDEREEAIRNKATVGDLMKPQHLKPFGISLTVLLFTQASGIVPVLSNLSVIFKAAGSTLDDNVSAMVVGAMQVVATAVAVFLMDRAGRKLLLVLSATFMCLSLVALGVFFALLEDGDDTATKDLGWLPLASLVVYFCFFSIGFGPIGWLLMSELFSPSVKETASSLTTMVNWLAAFGITLAFEPLQDVVGAAWVYVILAGCCLMAATFSALVVPETKGLTLHQISAYFTSPTSTTDFPG